MKFDFEVFLAALGLVMVFEGLPYFISPDMTRKVAVKMLEFDPRALRMLGLVSICAGLAVIALARSLG